MGVFGSEGGIVVVCTRWMGVAYSPVECSIGRVNRVQVMRSVAPEAVLDKLIDVEGARRDRKSLSSRRGRVNCCSSSSCSAHNCLAAVTRFVFRLQACASPTSTEKKSRD